VKNNHIGASIRRLREERGWSTVALERRSGVGHSEIARLERDPEAGVTLRTLQRLADAFAISVSELTADVAREPDEDPMVAQQVEALVRAVDSGMLNAEQALTILRNQGFLDRRPSVRAGR